MKWILFLFSVSLVVLLLCLLTRSWIFRTIKKKLRVKYEQNLELKSGSNTLSIRSLNGVGSGGKISLINLNIRIHPFGFFRTQNKPLFEISADKLHLDVNILKKERVYDSPRKNLEKWIIKKLGTFVTAFLIRSASIIIHDLSISVKGYTFKMESFEAIYNRGSETYFFDLVLSELVFIKNVPSIRAPMISFRITSTIDSIRYMLTNSFHLFTFNISGVSILYENGKLKILECRAGISIENDPLVRAELIIPASNIVLPVFDVITQNLLMTIKDISISKNRIEAKHFNIVRMSQTILAASYFLFKKKKIICEPIEMCIPSTMIMDIGLLSRFIKEKIGPREIKIRDNRVSSARQIVGFSPLIKVRILLSDKHILKLELSKVNLKEMVLSSKTITCDIVFGSQLVKLFEFRKAHFHIEPPKVDLKIRNVKIILSNDFAENCYFQDLLVIYKFIQQHLRGNDFEKRKEMPPMRVDFCAQFQECTIHMERSPITNEIIKQNEAKRAASEALRVRQRKAVEIIEANDSSSFNQGAFDSASSSVFLKLYKEALKIIPDIETDICTCVFKGLEFGVNGFTIPNRDAAIKRLLEISPGFDPLIIGKIGGGSFFFSAASLAISIPCFGPVITLIKFDWKGQYFTVHKKGHVAKDFFDLKIKCDNGTNEFSIPQVASRSVIFLDIHSLFEEFGVRFSPSILEFTQDFKFATSLFRIRKFKIKHMQFIDLCRFRLRVKAEMKANHLRIGINTNMDPYREFSSMELDFCQAKFLYDGQSFLLESDSLQVSTFNRIPNKPFITLYSPQFLIKFSSHNPVGSNYPRPLFIPVDSSRILDSSYDPFELYRTHTFSFDIKASFADIPSLVDIDQFQYVIDLFLAKKRTIELYQRPAIFAKRFTPWPKFSHINLSMQVPQLSMTMSNCSISIKVVGQPISILYNGSDQILCIESKSIIIPSLINSRPFFSVSMNDFSLKKNPSILQISASDSVIDITQTFFQKCPEFVFQFPKKQNLSELGVFENNNDLYTHFVNTIMSVVFRSITFRIMFTEENKMLQGLLKNLILETRHNDQKLALHTIVMNYAEIKSDSSIPLIKLEGPQICLSTAINRTISTFTITHVDMNISQEENEFFTPLIKKILKGSKPKSPERNPALFFLLNISKLHIKLLQHDRSPMLSAGVEDINAMVNRQIDQSDIFKIVIKKLNAIQDHANDIYHDLFEVKKSTFPLFSLQMSRTKPIMRCPVFDRIEAKISPFIIKVSIPFLKEVGLFFKSTDDLHVLDIEEMEIENAQLNSEPILQVPEGDQNNEGLFFCRFFKIQPFEADLSIRFPKDSMFTEFIDRPFSYKGLEFEDLFGTKHQMVAMIKKNIKWTVITSLPKILFQKQRKE